MITIKNGVDTELFKPDPAARVSLRHELGLKEDAFLIGVVARFDPQKDHANFIQAAHLLHKRHKNVHFVLCGKDISINNIELMAWIQKAEVQSVCHLLGLREDIPRIQAALDIACLSSYGETSALVIGESMACGVPCAVTDVGDLKLIVGETGKCVPSRDSVALAAALSELVLLPPSTRQEMGQRARQRIVNSFEIRQTTREYEKVWQNIILESNKDTVHKIH
jgi:glycosyltransferase involved in cell wall biosynthesis